MAKVSTARSLQPWLPFLVAILAFLVALAFAAWEGTPDPAFQDEFAYLLAAETFAEGRLTNPVPPAAWSLQTFHVLDQPTYMAKYPPGQGLALALAVVLGAPAIVGVWISFAAASAAIYWMLAGWLGVRWALVGSGLFVLQLGINNYWTHSYWGGCVTTAGAALVLGAIARLRSGPALASAIALGVGLVVLLHTRPLEGFAVGLITALAMLIDSRLRASWWSRAGRWRVLLPVVLLLAAGVVSTLVYNHAVTDDALELPYRVYEQQHNPFPWLLWNEPRASSELEGPRHRAFVELYDVWLRANFERQQSFAGWLAFKADRVWDAALLMIGPLFGLGLLVAPLAGRRRLLLYALACGGVVLAILLCTTSFRPQYLAPGYPAVLLLATLGLAELQATAQRRWRRFRFAVTAGVLLLLALVARLAYEDPRIRIASQRTATNQRVQLEQQLHSEGGQHLVFVDSYPPYSPHDEWVYNAPDPTRAPIVWVRFLDQRSNDLVFEAYPGRKAWRVELGVGDPRNVGLYEFDEPSDWR